MHYARGDCEGWNGILYVRFYICDRMYAQLDSSVCRK